MTPGEVAAILFLTFGVLIALRVPVAFALGLACVPVFFLDDRLTPILMIGEMTKAYNAFVLLAVPFFILAANLMNSSGITQRLVDLSRAIVGHFPGGLGHINVVVSMIFAGISGSSTADAAGIGSVLIPAMKKQGYDSSFTVAITACSSVMGVIIPPSILMVVWGGIMSVSIGGLFLAGFLPGIMIGLSQMVAVFIYAKIRNYPVYARTSVREFFLTLGRAFFALLSPGIVVGGVVFGFVTPTEASVLAVLYTFVVGLFIYRSITLPKLPAVLYETARLASISLFCIGTASAFGWVLAYYQLPKMVVAVISPWASSVTSAGLIIAGIFLIVGCFIDAVPAMIIFGAILQPLALHVGMHPVHFAIIGVISLAFGLVTPPYGLCLLIACTIGKIKVVESLKDVATILIPMLLMLLFVIMFPKVILFLPRLIMPKFV
ncbi:MAG TPA: TRAP transporter large permease [Candidatus Methylomirabilis sp.]|nr:TRAP transporter large permease [Candidatus Methylomirabilis sp.]